MWCYKDLPHSAHRIVLVRFQWHIMCCLRRRVFVVECVQIVDLHFDSLDNGKKKLHQANEWQGVDTFFNRRKIFFLKINYKMWLSHIECYNGTRKEKQEEKRRDTNVTHLLIFTTLNIHRAWPTIRIVFRQESMAGINTNA